jgi:hypothetical protein
MIDPRYPIGRFAWAGAATAAQRAAWIGHIEQAPAQLRAALRGFTAGELDTPYREGG